ncbi:hypothetical protein BKA66DRAFT_431107 [Pyrenochaeta sp. MPI-SDFR-AT-0127]|nr:hypothetical protein BKA66DRAFT_431107 [Pyrenochaeta sp. MPI-SDFR-AT-0127]
MIGSMHSTEDPDAYIFKCCSPKCKGKTFGRWYDLKRHHDGAHASQRKVFWCEEPGCKRSAAIGRRPFARKDKLMDHVRKMHIK